MPKGRSCGAARHGRTGTGRRNPRSTRSNAPDENEKPPDASDNPLPPSLRQDQGSRGSRRRVGQVDGREQTRQPRRQPLRRPAEARATSDAYRDFLARLGRRLRRGHEGRGRRGPRRGRMGDLDRRQRKPGVVRRAQRQPRRVGAHALLRDLPAPTSTGPRASGQTRSTPSCARAASRIAPGGVARRARRPRTSSRSPSP